MKSVEANHDGWSDWIAPNPNGYRMVCCDCHLAHDIEFRVVEKEDRDDGSWEHGEPLDSNKFRTIFRVRRNNRSTSRLRNSAAALRAQEKIMTSCERPGLRQPISLIP